MHARSITITGRPEAVDEGIAFIRDEVQPVITVMDGCVGVSLVVDRVSGRCIATSAWETPESMALAEDDLVPLRVRAGEILGGEPEVDRWEIAAMHRVQHARAGAWCRVNWARPQDIYIHVMVERFRNPLLRQVEAMDGFCSASVFVDRLERRICTTATFESRAALEANREAAAAVRERSERDTGIEYLQSGEFEVALANLRVPELV
jgi:hypothetical protein